MCCLVGTPDHAAPKTTLPGEVALTRNLLSPWFGLQDQHPKDNRFLDIEVGANNELDQDLLYPIGRGDLRT